MPGQQTFDPRLIVVNVLGSTITQFAKGTFVTVERDSDAFSDEVGAAGDVVRILSADQRGTIKFTLMHASPSNDVLSALAVTDALTGESTGPSSVTDIRGTVFGTHFAAQSWVKKIPPAPYGTEATTVEWEIRCAKLQHSVGGTPPV